MFLGKIGKQFVDFGIIVDFFGKYVIIVLTHQGGIIYVKYKYRSNQAVYSKAY